jgi:Fic family protein
MSEGDSSASTEALLRALLRLVLEEQRERNEEITIGDQILILQDSGMSQAQAARILGIPPKQATSYFRNVTNKKLLAKLVKKQDA